MKATWEAEKKSLHEGRELKEKLDALRHDWEKASRAADYETAGRLQYGEIPALEAQMKEAEARNSERGEHTTSFLREEVTDEDIARVVARWTGLPVTRMVESRSEERREGEV